MRRMKSTLRKGLTLIELMIVVAIIGILASIAMSAYGGYITQARISEAVSIMQSIKGAQENLMAERQEFRGCDFNPAAVPTQKVQWTAGISCWSELGVAPSGGIRFQFATGSNFADPAALADVAFSAPAPTGDWYYVAAQADLDEDTLSAPTLLILTSRGTKEVVLNEGQ